MTSTETMKELTPAKLLHRIRSVYKDVSYVASKLKRLKTELYANVYAYVEALCSTRKLHPSEVFESLVTDVGASKQYWARCYAYGRTIRVAKLDVETVRPSSLCMLPMGKDVIEPKHLRPLAKLLNDGAGPAAVARALDKFGYKPNTSTGLKPLASARVAEIKKSKKSFKDWKPEIQSLAKQIAATTDGHVKVRLELYVNDPISPILIGEARK